MNRKILILTFLMTFMTSLAICQPYEVSLNLLPDERWWGGAAVEGDRMPFGDQSYAINLLGNTHGNQAQPLLISNQGRFVWCEDPIRFRFADQTLTVSSEYSPIQHGKAGETLQEAYLYASDHFFPPTGEIPHEMLFTHPQYNTWIELMYNQNQADILQYARDIIANGFPPGVLMIDDNWQEDYGVWDFKASRFPNPKAMIDELHEMGFKVMLWVCPFVSPDSEVFRELRQKRLLVSKDMFLRKPAVVEWWNGISAVIDLTNPDTQEWFHAQLNWLQDEYGVDGFKLDAGDAQYYTGDVYYHEETYPNRQTELFAEVGLQYPMNEYRACWKLGGQPLVQRLRDKGHNWDDLNELIPDILAQGLMGYAYTCPDMIGGGEFRSFLNAETIDQELIVRSTQTHALMPMMQFSVAPWRVLDEDQLAAVKKMVDLHQTFADNIIDLAHHAAKTGEPIVRHMEYVFPHQGYAEVNDQFMLGDDVLVAPMLDDTNERKVLIPKGLWESDEGEVIEGPAEIEVKVSLARLVYFREVE